MSAAQIPNLNSLRRGGPRLRGGRSRGAHDDHNHPPSSRDLHNNKDEIIRKTDLDASTSRLSAVETGYLDDPFAALLTSGGEAQRRLPLMNRGTYVRTTGIDRLVDGFCQQQPGRRKQIISLGAGSDTRFFRLKRKYSDIDLVYHELDFPTNAAAKIRMLQTAPARNTIKTLSRWNIDEATISDVGEGAIALHAPNYRIHPMDLRSLPGASLHRGGSNGADRLPGLDTQLPTLLVSECCLIYLSPSDANAVLSYFTSLFDPTTSLGIIIYEPIRPDDAFGRTMISNLTARGIHLQTLQTYSTLEAQRKRLQQHGFGRDSGGDGTGGIGASDVDFIWRSWIDEREKARIEGLEWMDEVEEWKLLMQHYCVVWGWRGHNPDNASGQAFDEWEKLTSQESN